MDIFADCKRESLLVCLAGVVLFFKYLQESWMNPGSFSQGLDIKLKNQIRLNTKEKTK